MQLWGLIASGGAADGCERLGLIAASTLVVLSWRNRNGGGSPGPEAVAPFLGQGGQGGGGGGRVGGGSLAFWRADRLALLFSTFSFSRRAVSPLCNLFLHPPTDRCLYTSLRHVQRHDVGRPVGFFGRGLVAWCSPSGSLAKRNTGAESRRSVPLR